MAQFGRSSGLVMLDRFEIIEILYRFLGKSGKRVLVWTLIVTILVSNYFWSDLYRKSFESILDAYVQFQTGKMMELIPESWTNKN